MKKIIYITAWLLGITVIGIALGFAGNKQNQRSVKAIDISIEQYGERFVTKDDILQKMEEIYPGIIGKPANEIDVDKLMRFLDSNPYTSLNDAFITVNGVMKVHVVQRRPIVRIFNKFNQSCYIDEKGKTMPLHPHCVARVIIANGNIENTLGKTVNVNHIIPGKKSDSLNVLRSIYNLALILSKDDFLCAQIEQLYISEDNEIELVPKVGNHRIILGEDVDLEEKLEKLKIFYKEGLSKTDWKKYHTINLKYKNQVVCSKQ